MIPIPIGIGLLLFYTGILCENAKKNWFIGIRTHWTLSSDRVWETTHKLGGKLFKTTGVIGILGVFI
ncbi:MAG: SdpI family protein [Candidatus Bathyarchaeia archaeon]